MNKHEGKYIGIEFDAPIVGDIENLNAPSHWVTSTPEGIVSHSSCYSASYDSYRVFDGDTSTQWYTRTSGSQWIQIQFYKPTWVRGFSWYIGGSYRPNAFTVTGSNDGVDWETLLESNSPNSTGRHDFAFSAGHYKYIRWTITSRYSSYIYLYEIEMDIGLKNSDAITVTGNEYKYVNGPTDNGLTLTREYPVEKVEKHPTRENAILLTIRTPYEFNNVLDSLIVDYDNSKGNLMGRGGLVESFSNTFTPSDLIPVPAVGETERIASTVGHRVIEFKPVVYSSINDDKQDKISASPGVVLIDFKDAGTIDP